jgi:hypothetical protein
MNLNILLCIINALSGQPEKTTSKFPSSNESQNNGKLASESLLAASILSSIDLC